MNPASGRCVYIYLFPGQAASQPVRLLQEEEGHVTRGGSQNSFSLFAAQHLQNLRSN